MKISDRRLRISDSLKISDFFNSLGVLQHPKHPQQYAYGRSYSDLNFGVTFLEHSVYQKQ